MVSIYDIRTLDCLTYYLTGVRNFIKDSAHLYPYSVGTVVKDGYLWLDLSQSGDNLHEFSHFVEASDVQIQKPNLSLERGCFQCGIREIKVECVQFALIDIAFKRWDTSLYSLSEERILKSNRANVLNRRIERLCRFRNKPDQISTIQKQINSKSLWFDTDYIVEKLRHNVKLSKML